MTIERPSAPRTKIDIRQEWNWWKCDLAPIQKMMPEKNDAIQVALCDDHRLVLDGIQRLLEEMPGTECAGAVASGEEALFLLEHVRVDVVLMDLDMPGIGGAEAMVRIKVRWPAVKVIILTMHDEPAVVRNLMEQGADGYLLKTCGREELQRALEAVHQGRKHFSTEITEALLRPVGMSPVDERLEGLTTREREVLAALAEGLSNKEIGERHFISPRTVDTHRTNLMRKLEVHNLAGLVRLAISSGLVK